MGFFIVSIFKWPLYDKSYSTIYFESKKKRVQLNCVFIYIFVYKQWAGITHRDVETQLLSI